MTSQNEQIIVLSNDKGDLFVLPQSMLEASRVPEDKKQAVQQALSGDVQGYLFNFSPQFQSAGINNPQTNTQNFQQQANTGVGGFGLRGVGVTGGNNTLVGLASNSSNNFIGQNQSR